MSDYALELLRTQREVMSVWYEQNEPKIDDARKLLDKLVAEQSELNVQLSDLDEAIGNLEFAAAARDDTENWGAAETAPEPDYESLADWEISLLSPIAVGDVVETLNSPVYGSGEKFRVSELRANVHGIYAMGDLNGYGVYTKHLKAPKPSAEKW